jgi:hypothetical protein
MKQLEFLNEEHDQKLRAHQRIAQWVVNTEAKRDHFESAFQFGDPTQSDEQAKPQHPLPTVSSAIGPASDPYERRPFPQDPKPVVGILLYTYLVPKPQAQ